LSDGHSGGNDQLEELIRKYGLPVGLVGAAIISFLIRAAGAAPVFAWFGLACLIGAVVVIVRMHSAAGRPGRAVVQFSTTPVEDEVRRQLLQDYLSQDLSYTRGRIESVTPYTAAVVYGKPVNHVLHLLASVFLCGLWLPVWILIAVAGGERRRVLSVDRCGNVTKS
jgi:hypothetical protein